MACKLVSKQKWDGEGRAFGSDANPIVQLIVAITTDGTIPSSYADIQKLDKCTFAPGSILMDTANGRTYIYDGTQFKGWG